jgi:phage shock protein B
MPPTVFFMITVGLPVICGTLIILAFIFLAAMRSRKHNNVSEDDTRLMQQMHQTLLRMEKRIDALETIYFEMDRSRKSKGGNL